VLGLVGNDVPTLARVAAGAAGRLEWRVSAELVARGRLGVKTGAGWYRYEGRTPLPDAEVDAIVREVASAAGIPQVAIGEREIVERYVLALVNEGAAVLDEGVAARGGDIDVVFVDGYGFPADRGGPMHFADALGAPNVARIMARFARRPGGERWRPHPLIERTAAADRLLGEWSAVGPGPPTSAASCGAARTPGGGGAATTRGSAPPAPVSRSRCRARSSIGSAARVSRPSPPRRA